MVASGSGNNTNDQPVWYASDDFAFGFTTIKDISNLWFFTTYAAPSVKNKIHLANKYIKKIPLDQVRNALCCTRVPPNEELLWQSWLALQSEMEDLRCQATGCAHVIKSWKWDQLTKEMRRCGTTSGGYVLCRPCAEYNSLVNKKHRPAPYAAQAVAPPWRTKAPTVFDQIKVKHQQKLQERLAAVATMPEAEQDAARQKINEEAAFCVVVAVLS